MYIEKIEFVDVIPPHIEFSNNFGFLSLNSMNLKLEFDLEKEVSIDISEKQKRLLKMILTFDSACKELGIKYSIACGSALGGVREKGFIPWDEDLDIMMRISDYKLMEENCKQYKDKFQWVSYNVNDKSPVIMARIYENHFDFNYLEQFPYIDIHVYVGSSDNIKQIKKEIKLTDFLIKVFWVKKRKYRNIFKRKKSLIGTLCKIPFMFIPSDYCYKKVIKHVDKWPYDESSFVMPIQGYYAMKEVVPKRWLDHYMEIDFSGHKLCIICEYNRYLTQLYGDYMTPVRYHD